MYPKVRQTRSGQREGQQWAMRWKDKTACKGKSHRFFSFPQACWAMFMKMPCMYMYIYLTLRTDQSKTRLVLFFAGGGATVVDGASSVLFLGGGMNPYGTYLR